MKGMQTRCWRELAPCAAGVLWFGFSRRSFLRSGRAVHGRLRRATNHTSKMGRVVRAQRCRGDAAMEAWRA